MQVGQFHRQAHVALDLDLALEESLLRVQLTGYKICYILVINGERDIAFVFAIIFNGTLAFFGVDDPVAFVAVGAVPHFETVDSSDLLDELVFVRIHGFFEDLHVFVDFEVLRIVRYGGDLVGGGVGESFAVHGDDDGASESQVVLESDASPWHLVEEQEQINNNVTFATTGVEALS